MVLTELRKIYKITMQQLADGISVSKQLIGQIEKGQRAITDDVLLKLVKYFGLDRDITDDFRRFFLKSSMSKLEISKIKLIKLKKESENIRFEDVNPDTGEKHIANYDTLDKIDYLKVNFDIEKEDLINKIEKRLEGVVSNSLQEEINNNIDLEIALSKALRKIDFFKSLISLDENADPYIFEMLVRALNIATYGRGDSNEFIIKVLEIIQKESERKENEKQKIKKMW